MKQSVTECPSFLPCRMDSDDEEKGAQDSKKDKKLKDEDGVDEKEDIDFIEQWDDDEGIGFEEVPPHVPSLWLRPLVNFSHRNNQRRPRSERAR